MGHRVYFTTAIDLAPPYGQSNGRESFLPRDQGSTRPKLLIIDEVGYLALEQAHASLIFQAICERYEKRQASSNKASADWGQVFAGDPIMASLLSTGCCTDRPSSTSAATAQAQRETAGKELRGRNRGNANPCNPHPEHPKSLQRGSILRERKGGSFK